MDYSTILSVGIDIGTTTTQIVFTRLMLKNTAAYFAIPHISFVGKELLYNSHVYYTPLLNDCMLDGEALYKLILHEYAGAGFTPADLDSGAVIITGESARKENAALLLDQLSGLAGEFVVSTAGPELEAVIAGKGSGAYQASKDQGLRVINLDIGGGTTNIAVFDQGDTLAKGSFDIGGRLIRVENNIIRYISPSAARIATAADLYLNIGDTAVVQQLYQLAKAMASLLEQASGLAPASPLLREIATAGSAGFIPPGGIQAICFSGGIADCMRENYRDPFCFGDIGPLLGQAIRDSLLCGAFQQLPADETIRATVVGAGSYSTSISGSTILHQQDILPLKNLPSLKLSKAEEARCYAGEDSFLQEKIAWFLRQSDASQFVLALDGEDNPSYASLKTLASYLFTALNNTLPQHAPLLVALKSDTGKALGQAILSLAGKERAVICIDGVQIEQGDYIDLGRPLMSGMVIPVVVKTLAFG